MQKMIPDDNKKCLPFYIGKGDSNFGSRIGGSHPVGILPEKLSIPTRYFATVQIAKEPVLEISIFLCFNFKTMLTNSKILHSDDGLIKIIMHGESQRVDNPEIVSELSAHPLYFKEERDDFIVDEGNDKIVYPSHKLGGRAYLINSEFQSQVDDIEKEGYAQVVQFDFPGAEDDSISGSWPFADGEFHIFGKDILNESKWIYFWEY